jgi:hypothetical protein
VPQGAEEADGADALVRAVRGQIGRGADVVKLYADYRWGPNGEGRPTFSEAELRLAVETAASSGRPVVAHASTPEGMRRAALAGVQTIEHGDDGTPEVWRLMARRGVALCPTVAAGDAVARYRGYRPGVDPEPARVTRKRASVRAAIAAGVTICNGSDAGVFAHGDNAREPELLVGLGMSPLDALRARDERERARARPRRPRAAWRPGCWPTSWPSTATRRATWARCGACGSWSRAAGAAPGRGGAEAARGGRGRPVGGRHARRPRCGGAGPALNRRLAA